MGPRLSVMAQALVLSSALWASACGPNCQQTCNHIFDGSGCGLEQPGTTAADQIGRCVEECEGALQQAGTVGSYNPTEPNYTGKDVDLANEQQAAAWMDCVWFYTPDSTKDQCESLEQGYCAPTSF
jgi:hypothetical protein